MSIKFNGIMNDAVAFNADAAIPEGTPVKLTESGKVAAAAKAEPFFGVALNYSKKIQSVQLHGYVAVKYTSAAPDVGFVNLSADGAGGVQVDDTKGREMLVVSVDTSAKTVGIIL